MKTGRGADEVRGAPVSRGAKWKASCWVTASGGSRTCWPSSGASQAPAATTTTGARHDRLAVCTTAPASEADTSSTGER